MNHPTIQGALNALRQVFAALNPEGRRPLRFYALTLWAYFSLAATIVCILLPLLARTLTAINKPLANEIGLALAILLELIWLCYALTVFSWRLSGYLYSNAATSLRSIIQRINTMLREHIQNMFQKKEA